MTGKDYAMLQAANLRVSYEDRDLEGMVLQLALVSSMDEAKDLIIALTIASNTPVNDLRKMLSRRF